MELYVYMPLISFVVAGAGAFFGAYLAKKGENLATHEDIAKLVDQVRAVTQATKEIEAKISDEVWGRQRVWEMKRDAIFALMKAESAAKETLLTLTSTYEVWRNDSQAAMEARKAAAEIWFTAFAAFEVARAPVSLVCGQDLEARLDSLCVFLTRTASDVIKGQTSVSTYGTNLEKECLALLAAVRKELGTDYPPSKS